MFSQWKVGKYLGNTYYFPISFGAVKSHHPSANYNLHISLLHEGQQVRFIPMTFNFQYSDCDLSPHPVVQSDAGLLCDLKDMVGSVPEILTLFIQRKQVVAQRRDVWGKNIRMSSRLKNVSLLLSFEFQTHPPRCLRGSDYSLNVIFVCKK